MKGTIACCLRELVIEKFGKEAWEKTMEKSGLEKNTVFLAMDDVADEAVLSVVSNLCGVLGINLEQAADAFGEYWCTVYAPRIYKGFFLGARNSRDFLLRMDSVHELTTKTIKNATPPRFRYEDKDKDTLVMTYVSKRNLMPIFQGLVKGVGKHFGEELKLRALSSSQLEITFPSRVPADREALVGKGV
ncbi:MAG: heme NO-binding domain-containing protein [Nitrospirota bacterium]